jgi:hypothetical protein
VHPICAKKGISHGLGSKWLDKKIFYQSKGIGEVSQILMGWPADREDADLMVAGNQGVQFVDLKLRGSRISTVPRPAGQRRDVARGAFTIDGVAEE